MQSEVILPEDLKDQFNNKSLKKFIRTNLPKKVNWYASKLLKEGKSIDFTNKPEIILKHDFNMLKKKKKSKI